MGKSHDTHGMIMAVTGTFFEDESTEDTLKWQKCMGRIDVKIQQHLRFECCIWFGVKFGSDLETYECGDDVELC